MIPQRIVLEGFLSYGSRQEIDLSDLALCMLSGANGSGKSSVFDAVTFALFGAHRGGEQGHEDLIHRGHDGFAVEFEFLLNGALWKVRRTFRRRAMRKGAASGRRPATDHAVQLSRWDAPAEQWVVVPDTSTQGDFKNWVADNLGLTFDTFTCSMLLRQGDAERVVSAAAKDRFDVLAGVVGLDRYQRLEELAKERRREADAEARALQLQLNGVPPVEEPELAQADAAVESTRAGQEAAARQVESLQSLHAEARQWSDLRARIADAQVQRRSQTELLARAGEIESAVGRLAELREVLPPLSLLADQRQSLADAQAKVIALEKEQQAKQSELAAAAGQLELAAAGCRTLSDSCDADQAREKEAARRHQELDKLLAQAAPYERARREIEEVRRVAARLPADPAGLLAAAHAEAQRLAALRAALPALGRLAEFRTARAAVCQALQENLKASEALAEVTRDAEARHAEARWERDAAERAAQVAWENQTLATAQANVARRALAALREVGARADCPTCGQALTDEHRLQEEERRSHDLEKADALLREAGAQWTDGQAARDRLNQAVAGHDLQAKALHEQARDLDHAQRQGRRDLARHSDECRRAYQELAEPFQLRVAPVAPDDWSITVWPAPTDLAEMARDAASLAAAQARLAEAQEIHDRWKTLALSESQLAQALETCPAELPADLSASRSEFETVLAEHQTLTRAMESARLQLIARQAERQRLADRRQQVQRDVDTLDRDRGLATQRRQHLEEISRETLLRLSAEWAKRVDQLSPDLLGAKVAALGQEAKRLESDGAEEDARKLGQAREQAGRFDATIAAWEADAARLPAAAHRGPQAVQAELDGARQNHKRCDDALREATRRREMLGERREQRKVLLASHGRADRRHRNYKLLADLLGRGHLQMHLLRQAERAIVEHANQVLDRLSGGELSLNLRDNTNDNADPHGTVVADQAFDLESVPRRSGAGAAIPVTMLSGSQKFRVAVSLALAIGQYAGGRHRCGEWVVIDEGFGSLDKEGQGVMIDELHKLKGLLKRIILVSHQESFAAAFPDGYRLRLENGETRVERVRGSGS